MPPATDRLRAAPPPVSDLVRPPFRIPKIHMNHPIPSRLYRLRAALPRLLLLAVLPWCAFAACGGGDGPFHLGPGAQLSLESVEPASGPASGGTLVRVRGAGFAPGCEVRFGGVVASAVAVFDEGELQCVVPGGAPGAVDVEVATGGRLSMLEDGYLYYACETPMALSAVEPAHGPACGGTRVRVLGSGFVPGEAHVVRFGDAEATAVEVLGAGELVCTTPEGAAGPVDVSVQRGDCVESLTGAFEYAGGLGSGTDLDGDGRADLVVAAPGDGTAGAGAGAVHVWFGAAGRFQSSVLDSGSCDVVLLGASAGDGFGGALAAADIDGDGDTDMLVGAPGTDQGAALDAGAVYAFFGPFAGSGTPSSPLVRTAQQADRVWTAAPGGAGDGYGSAIAAGDVDGDGVVDLHIAAPGRDAAGRVDAGSVYRHAAGPGVAGGSATQALARHDGARAGDRLGTRLARLAGNAGSAGLVASAPWADPVDGVLLPDAGEVYVLHGARLASGGTVTGAPVLHGERAGDLYGSALATGDLDGDGRDDVVVGAPEAMDPYLLQRTGRAYLHVLPAAGWLGWNGGSAAAATAVRAGLPGHASFGQTVELADIDGDGRDDLLVGAPRADCLSIDNGRAYLYVGGASPAYLNALGADASWQGTTQPYSGFGKAGAAFDWDGDGCLDIAWSSDREDGGRGVVHLWRGGAGAHSGAHAAQDCDTALVGAAPGGCAGAQVLAVR